MLHCWRLRTLCVTEHSKLGRYEISCTPARHAEATAKTTPTIKDRVHTMTTMQIQLQIQLQLQLYKL
jgi:hypothetical protein